MNARLKDPMRSPTTSSLFLLSLAGLSTSLVGAPANAATLYQNPSYSSASSLSKLSEASARSDSYHDGKFRGRTFSAYYGHVQVAAEIKNGELVYVDVLRYPTDYRTSRIINSRALPRLESEVVSAQSARVNVVSGATLSSMAFLRSLQTALDRAQSGR